jgi:hypothetical protein
VKLKRANQAILFIKKCLQTGILEVEVLYNMIRLKKLKTLVVCHKIKTICLQRKTCSSVIVAMKFLNYHFSTILMNAN